MHIPRLLSWRILLPILAVTILLAWHELSRLPDGKLHVHFLDVGQGDAILLVSPSGKQMLVDGGPDMSVLEHLGKYMPFFDRSIDLVVLTHPHADHLTSFAEVLRRYKVNHVLLAGTEHGPGRYKAFLNEITRQRIPVSLADPSADINLGDGVVLDILWPDEQSRNHKNLNNASVTIRVLFGEESILLTGDIEKEAESAILAAGADIRSGVLKVPHHGSKTSSSTGFLIAVNPEHSVISAGEENDFGHPHQEVLERYSSLRIPVQTTIEGGIISYTFE